MIGIFLALWVVVIAITIGESIDNTAKAKIVIFFVQTLPMVLGPQFRTSDWLELVNLSGGSSSVLSCLAPWDFYQQFLFNILLPYVRTPRVANMLCLRVCVCSPSVLHRRVDLCRAVSQCSH